MISKFIKIILSCIAFTIWWLISILIPFRFQLKFGDLLGTLLYNTNISRKKVAEVNIRKCFPKLTETQQQELVKGTLKSTIKGAFESSAAWFWPNWRLKNKYTIEGLEHLTDAKKNNKGVVLMTFHFTTLEIGASIFSLNEIIDGLYRPHKNPIYEKIQAWGRMRRNKEGQVIPNGDMRSMIKSLRKGRIVAYLPDQDFGQKRSVFVPFFKIPTATLKVTSQLAKAGKAEVIPWVCKRVSETGKYAVKVYPSLSQSLGTSEEEDARIINEFIEERIREAPVQYLWVHRRFKTRPLGEDSFYK